jgi:hypothetical protein
VKDGLAFFIFKIRGSCKIISKVARKNSEVAKIISEVARKKAEVAKLTSKVARSPQKKQLARANCLQIILIFS